MNPRNPQRFSGFQDRRIKPLCHLSAVLRCAHYPGGRSHPGAALFEAAARLGTAQPEVLFPMLKPFLAAALVLACTPAALAATPCAGADPALTSAAVKNVTTDGGINHYSISGVVTNTGRARQASNVLQFVDVYRDREKLDNIGIPPLKPGQSYTFSWTFDRSTEAGDGTTRLHLRLRMTNPPGGSPSQNCNADNDTRVIQF